MIPETAAAMRRVRELEAELGRLLGLLREARGLIACAPGGFAEWKSVLDRIDAALYGKERAV